MVLNGILTHFSSMFLNVQSINSLYIISIINLDILNLKTVVLIEDLFHTP